MELKVFVVDDDPIMVMLMTRLIQNAGFKGDPYKFENGAQALAYFKEHYSINDAYVIFLDINMPEMNGWELLDALKSLGTRSNIEVVIVTSSTDDHDKELASKQPLVKEFLSKPVHTQDLLSFSRRLSGGMA